MLSKTIIKSNAYFDSVTLMKISGQVASLEGIKDVLVGMGTDLNKDSLKNVGLLTEEAEKVSPNDLMIGINAQDEKSMENAFIKINELLNKKGGSRLSTDDVIYENINQVANLNEGYNMAVISTPGIYAAREAKKALNEGIHVFMFSDNVTVEEEIELKDLANQRGLLMMGPDCGTAIINGVPLGFANRVRKGDIGIVGASGTGTQQVTTLIDVLGAGVSQVIGTGGRDLSSKVEGRTMLAALDALKDDDETKVIVIISKPPSKEVAAKIFDKAQNIGKKVVLCLLGAEKMENLGENIIQCSNLEETAIKAVSLSMGREVSIEESDENKLQIQEFFKLRTKDQKYVRGLFGGGTLCDEAMTVFRNKGVPMYSNIPLDEDETLTDIDKSKGNTFIDMGDDYFTNGKPHPMIEPYLRNKRIVQDATDPETAVMFLDVELGHGCHKDPAGVVVEAAKKANEILATQGRKVLWIASLIGTENDPQNMNIQKQKLKDAGFAIYESNVRAAEMAASLVLI